jgi:hypothetical protein
MQKSTDPLVHVYQNEIMILSSPVLRSFESITLRFEISQLNCGRLTLSDVLFQTEDVSSYRQNQKILNIHCRSTNSVIMYQPFNFQLYSSYICFFTRRWRSSVLSHAMDEAVSWAVNLAGALWLVFS